MGLRAPNSRNRVFAELCILPALALFVAFETRECSAGLSGLNILQHEQLHKGRGISEELRPGKSNQRVEHSAKSSAATSGSSEDGEPRKAYLTATKPVQDNGNVYLAALEEYVDAETAKAADRQAAVKPNLPAVGNAEADSHGKSHLTALEQKEAVAKVDTALARPPRSKRLDIVLSHFHPDRVQPALDFWLDFLESDKVQKLQPYVWLYCQNENRTVDSDMAPLLKYGGQVVHLENVGRESHAFLQHITGHYGDLADHTLFSQDIPEAILLERFEKIFDNTTGFLPLSFVGHVDCKDEWLPQGEMPQMYSLLTREFCPPEGFTASFQGQFVVSRRRILDQNWWVYKRLLDLLAAPLDHWMHDQHDNEYYKDRSNPFFGHILERSWTLAFNCYESWREGNCWWCDVDMHMENCGTDACQCIDR